MPRLVLAEIFVGPLLHRGVRVQDVHVALRCLGRGDGGQAFEVRAGGFVQPDRNAPLADLGDGGRQMHDRILLERHGTVAGRAPGGQFDGARAFFHGLHGGEPHLAVLARHAATFGEAELRVDFRQVLVDHVLDADAGSALFARFGQEDHVAVERHVLALQRQHGHQGGDHVVLVVHRAAPVDVAAVAGGPKGWERPLGGIHVHRVGVRHDEQGLFAAVAFEPGHHVRPVRFEREGLDRNALGLEHLHEVLGRLLFAARRIAGVEPHQGLEVPQGFFFERSPVGLGGAERGGCEQASQQDRDELFHRASIAPRRGDFKARALASGPTGWAATSPVVVAARRLDARAGSPFHRHCGIEWERQGAEHMDDDRREELRETFDTFDRDGSGTIGIEEFGNLLKLLGAGMSAAELRIGFRELDQDGSGAIGFEEFYAWWTDQ
jgi:calmodulin